MAQNSEIEQMVFPQFPSPLLELPADFAQYLDARIQLDPMALAVIKSDGFDALIRGKRLGQACRGILAA